jgi:hypothetical protein
MKIIISLFILLSSQSIFVNLVIIKQNINNDIDNNINPILPKFLQVKNPDQPSGDSNGGDSGEFLRRDQPAEHILIPLINELEAEYIFIPDIRTYRNKEERQYAHTEKLLKYNEEEGKIVEKLLSENNLSSK